MPATTPPPASRRASRSSRLGARSPAPSPSSCWPRRSSLPAVVVRGAIDAVRRAGKAVGIYSTPYQWNTIAGDFSPGLPVWIAGAPNLQAASGWCNRSFAGGPVVRVQTLPVRFDENLTCPGHGPMRRFFAT